MSRLAPDKLGGKKLTGKIIWERLQAGQYVSSITRFEIEKIGETKAHVEFWRLRDYEEITKYDLLKLRDCKNKAQNIIDVEQKRKEPKHEKPKKEHAFTKYEGLFVDGKWVGEEGGEC